MFQGSQKPARHLPDLVPSSCALAPRQTREAGFLVTYNFSLLNPISHGLWNDVVPWGGALWPPLVFLALGLPKAKNMLSDKYFGL